MILLVSYKYKINLYFLSLFLYDRLETEFAGRTQLRRIKKDWKDVRQPQMQGGFIYL